MIRGVLIGLFVVLAGCLLPAANTGATHYIATAGSDSNNGTSTATPWAHAPGMANCAAACGSYVPTAGDRFILKGGDTWTNGSFPWTITWSGAAGNPIYFGVDQTWFSGGSWTRPVFDMQSLPAGANNVTVDMVNSNFGVNYVTLDNFEVVNFRWAGKPIYGNAVVFSGGVSQNLLIQNMYVHAWTHDTPGGCAGDCDALHVVQGSPNAPYNAGSQLTDSICDGAPSGTDSGMCTYAWPYVARSIARNLTNGFLVSANATVRDSQVYKVNPSYDPGVHQNLIESTSGGTNYIFNNVLHDISGMHVAVFIGGGNGSTPETDYFWNNVVYNVNGAAPLSIDSAPAAGGSAYVWNNTLEASSSCIRAGRPGQTIANLLIENNHCISDISIIHDALVCDASWDSGNCSTVAALTLITNVVMTHATAITQGFTAGNSYAETSISNSTYRVGTNLASLCSGGLTSLCADVSGVQRTSSAWDVGAYEFLPIGPAPASTMFAIKFSNSSVSR